MSTSVTLSDKLANMCQQKRVDIVSQFGGDIAKADKFTSDLRLMSLEPSIRNCEDKSIFITALQVVQTDLSIIKQLGEAYLVPYKGKATLQIGYKGWLKLAKQSGYTIQCEAVYTCDDFDFSIDEKGKHLKMKANFDDRDDSNSKWVHENIKGVVVWVDDGNSKILEFVNAKKLKQLKNNSPASEKSPAWNNWASEMYRAKAIKWVVSKLPQTEKVVKLQELENRVERVGDSQENGLSSSNDINALVVDVDSEND